MINAAIVLAAGRGERLRPLTDSTPKPLIEVGDRPLIFWHLEALARAGVPRVVVNTAWLEHCFEPLIGDGSRWGLRVLWSHEGRDHAGALETAGGIAKALPKLGEVFWVVAGDVFLPDFVFDAQAAARVLQGDDLAHLWLVPNAAHHPGGDFALTDEGRLHSEGPQRLTWASVGLFRAELFAAVHPGTRRPLRPLLDQALAAGRLGGSRLQGHWTDVGTPERLEQARQWVRRAQWHGSRPVNPGPHLGERA